MKNKKLLFFTILSALVLTSCRITILKTKDMEMTVNSLFNGEVDDSRSISYIVKEGEELLPYLSLSNYLSLYDKYIADGYKYDLNESTSGATVTFESEESPLFMVAIDYTAQAVALNGDFSNIFTFSKDYSKSSLYVDSDTQSEVALAPVSVREFSYRNLGFTTFTKNRHVYFPLSLLECIFSSYSGVYHFYNYNRLLQYSEYEELTNTTYKVDGENVTAFKEMKNYINNSLEVMPLYLRKDRRASFLFTLENQYGLKYTRIISSMRKYLEEQDFFTDFLSENNLKRNEAYYKTFALLDDGHTSIRDSADYPYKEGDFNPYGPHLQRILSVRQSLSAQRELAPGEVYYSTDNKLAFFTFDSFSFALDAFKEDGTTLKEDLSDYHSENYDSYFYFVKCLNEIRSKGGVNDVVIDISTNGGGTVGILLKLVTLLAKHNTSDVYLNSDVTGLVQKMSTKVDSNRDGVYDDSDVYGNDFKFHILTSEFSFSCGNAFPFYLKNNGIAQIIGQTSGGGECAVAESYLPSGEHYYHSSNTHIGWYNEGVFEGDEKGVTPDIAIEYKDFYNLDTLQSLINK